MAQSKGKNQSRRSEPAQPVESHESPEEPKVFSFIDPWGTRVTVGAELADIFRAAGYKSSK